MGRESGKTPEGESEIALDDRERASGLDRAIERVLGITPKIERLAVGDVLIGRRTLIERKAVADFSASIVDGRLFDQMAELTRGRFDPLVVLEGDFGEAGRGRLSAASLRGAILSVTLDWGVPILRSRDVEDTARWIEAIVRRRGTMAEAPDWRRVGPTGRRLGSDRAPARPMRRAVEPARRRREQAWRILSQIEGVGEIKARALIGHFGSVGAIFQAEPPALIEAPGIGRRLAEVIFEALHGEGA